MALNEAAAFLGPRLSVRISLAGAGDALSVRAARQVLPAVSKHQRVDHHSVAPGAEVIVCVAVVVAAEPTDATLERWSLSSTPAQTRACDAFPVN